MGNFKQEETPSPLNKGENTSSELKQNRDSFISLFLFSTCLVFVWPLERLGVNSRGHLAVTSEHEEEEEEEEEGSLDF